MPRPFSHPQFRQLMIIGVAVGVTIYLMVDIWPLGVDFYYGHYPSANQWWHGNYHLYDTSERHVFYNAPWMMLILAPFALVPVEYGQSALNVISLLCIFASIHLYKNGKTLRIYVIILAVLTLFVFDLLIRGQIDAFILLGLTLTWWGIQNRKSDVVGIGFWLMSMKPVNVLLPGLLFLITIRHWPHREQIRAISLPLISLVISCIFLGWDWPLQYVRYIQDNPPLAYISIELWKGIGLLGLPNWPFMLIGLLAFLALVWFAIRQGATPCTLSIALTTNLVFTNYAQDNHYILLIPAFIFVASTNWQLGLLIYPLAWTPLLRAVWGHDASALDVLYAVALWVSSWIIGGQAYKRNLKLEQAQDYTTPVLL